jgi:hypothetical protein
MFLNSQAILKNILFFVFCFLFFVPSPPSPSPAPSTFVNGRQITGATPLAHGDRLLLGVNYYLRAVLDPEAPRDPATDADWEAAVEELGRVNGRVPAVGGPDPETAAKLRELESTLEKQRAAAKEELDRERKQASVAATEEAQTAFKAREAELAEMNRRLESQLLRTKVEEAERQRKFVLEDTLVRTQNMCTEANSIAAEIGRGVVFEPKVITVFDRAGNQTPAAGVRFFDSTTGKAAIWDFEKFQTRLLLMRDVYDEFQEWEPRNDDEVFGIIPESDPFYDPPGSQLVGRAQVLLEALGFGLEVDDRYPLLDYLGRSVGHIVVKIVPTTLAGEEVDCPDDNPMELLGERLRFAVTVKGCESLPARIDGEIYAKYSFYRGEVVETDSAVPERGYAKFAGGSREYEVDINVEMIDHFREDCLAIEVYGDFSPEETPAGITLNGGDSGSLASATGSPVAGLISGSRRKRAISLSGLSSVLAPANRAAKNHAGSPSRQASGMSPLAQSAVLNSSGAGGNDPEADAAAAAAAAAAGTDAESGAPGRCPSTASNRGRSPLHGIFVSEQDGESLLSASGRFTTIAEERLVELEAKAAEADAAKEEARVARAAVAEAQKASATAGAAATETSKTKDEASPAGGDDTAAAAVVDDEKSKSSASDSADDAGKDAPAADSTEQVAKVEREREAALKEKSEKEAALRKRIEELEAKLEKTEVDSARKLKAKDEEIKDLTAKANKSKACTVQ